jgi:predicted LPLAT superfamily acyltransferase
MSTPASPVWLAQKERGSALLMATLTRIALSLGRPAGAALLYPICAYFMIFGATARRASRAYLQRVLGRAPTLRERFGHYHAFAATLLDRVFMQAGRLERFECSLDGVDALRDALAAGRGVLLVGAHLGSFEILRAIGTSECPVPIRVLMHDGHAQKMRRVMRKLDERLRAQVIPLGRPGTMLDVRDALARGEIVALLADRSMHGERYVECDFLGAPAAFPRGPFELAAMLDVPIVLFSAVYRGACRYDIRFEPLPVDGAAGERALSVDACCHAYAAWLAARCRAAPYNWFNFYDFWALPGSASRR